MKLETEPSFASNSAPFLFDVIKPAEIVLFAREIDGEVFFFLEERHPVDDNGDPEPPIEKANPLPVEFWNHQFLNLDPFDTEAVLEFSRKYGIIHSVVPRSVANAFERDSGLILRPCKEPRESYAAKLRSVQFDLYLGGALDAEILGIAISELGQESRAEERPDQFKKAYARGATISLWEAQSSIKHLQEVLAFYSAFLPLSYLPDGIKTTPRKRGNIEVLEEIRAFYARKRYSPSFSGVRELLEDPFYCPLSYSRHAKSLEASIGSRLGSIERESYRPYLEKLLESFSPSLYPTAILQRSDFKPYGSKGEIPSFFPPVIAHQFLATCSLDKPWRKCANPRCGRMFKAKQNYETTTENGAGRQRASRYCCEECRNERSKVSRGELKPLKKAKQRLDEFSHAASIFIEAAERFGEEEELIQESRPELAKFAQWRTLDVEKALLRPLASKTISKRHEAIEAAIMPIKHASRSRS